MLDLNNPISLRKFLREMLLIRRFEERCAEEYSAGKIRGFLHLCIGQEAVATGVMNALTQDDPIFSTYRDHGHALARGIDPSKIMAEMFGKIEGLCRGRGGSMHLFDVTHGFYGGNAIVGGGLPLAIGYALGKRLLNQRCVVTCLFGEGAIAEGEFHESMNLAALWHLPVLFLCENNLYAMGTALARSEAETDLCRKARSYGIKSASVDGMDVIATYHASFLAIKDIRELESPYFLECKTYRFRAHSMFDPELYRDTNEVDAWKLSDPILKLLKHLKATQSWTDDQFSEIDRDVTSIVTAAVEFAEKCEIEPESDLSKFVYLDASN